jgi:hypothetical protein
MEILSAKFGPLSFYTTKLRTPRVQDSSLLFLFLLTQGLDLLQHTDAHETGPLYSHEALLTFGKSPSIRDFNEPTFQSKMSIDQKLKSISVSFGKSTRGCVTYFLPDPLVPSGVSWTMHCRRLKSRQGTIITH